MTLVIYEYPAALQCSSFLQRQLNFPVTINLIFRLVLQPRWATTAYHEYMIDVYALGVLIILKVVTGKKNAPTPATKCHYYENSL